MHRALVTGASDGIGLGFAHELARLGFNVILHGRNSTKLEGVKARLQQNYPEVNFRIAVLDASSTSYRQIDKLVASLQDLHITVLINNVGGGDKISPLALLTADEVDSMINLNARFPTLITRALLPKLTKSIRPGLILTIGSTVDFVVPYAVTYGGSKAFNMAWSSSLRLEMKAEGNNVEVLAVLVGKVTETASYKEPITFWTPDGRTMARAALQRVGCGKAVVVGYIGHAMQKFVLDILPASVFAGLVSSHMKMLREKEQKEQKKR
jgi:short-subunit dehydrogenase